MKCITTYSKVATVTNDNQAVISFVRGDCVAQGIRHVELRMYYVREKYQEGNIIIDYEAGESLAVDQMTKVGTQDKFNKFRKDVLGLELWDGYDNYTTEIDYLSHQTQQDEGID